jgi:hypothetical protein
VLFLLATAGCGFHSVGGGDGGSHADMSVSDLGDSPDLFGVPPGSDLSTIAGGACAGPALLVGVENLSNTGSGGGRVARVSFAGGSAQPCATLAGQGLIGSQPMAVTAFGSLVGAATFDGLYVVDPTTDTVKWSKPNPDSANGYGPFDAFTVSGTSATYVAAAWGPDFGISGAAIRWVEIYDADGNAAPGAPYCIQQASCTDLELGLGTYSMASDPARPGLFLAIDGSHDLAALEVNPFATPPSHTTYVGTYSESLSSIYAVNVGGKPHLAWFDDNMSGGAIQWAIDNGSAPSLNGPFKCTSNCATILHVVPDPSQTNGFFALCDGAMVNTRTVVRADDAGNCSVVLDGTQFGTESRLSRLAIAP